MKKQCALLALILVLAFIPALAEAPEEVAEEALEEAAWGDYYYVVLEDGAAAITYWDGEDAELDIPAELDGHPVTMLGENAFSYSETLERVTLPEGLTCIDDGAFLGCTALTFVALPERLNEVGANPFEGCAALETIEIAEGNSDFTFDGHALVWTTEKRLVTAVAVAAGETYEIPVGIAEIGASAFGGCDTLMAIEVPEGVETIGANAFAGCVGLTDVALPDSVTALGDYAFADCEALESISLPATLAEIPDGAFSGCASLNGVAMPAGIERIGDGAFEGCVSLSAIDLPEGLRVLGDGAFGGCAMIEAAALPASIEAIGLNPFMDCEALTALSAAGDGAYLSVADGVLFADGGARLVCYPSALEAERYAVPEGTTAIGDFAFFCCERLISVMVPDSVAEIGTSTFEGRANLTLTVGRDSYAAGYARENMLKYTYPGADAWLGQ